MQSTTKTPIILSLIGVALCILLIALGFPAMGCILLLIFFPLTIVSVAYGVVEVRDLRENKQTNNHKHF